jgi:hypothetical protein
MSSSGGSSCTPKDLHRIRHYGLLANTNRFANIAKARELLAAPPLTSRDREGRRRRSALPTSASLPLLRRPHADHRDLRSHGQPHVYRHQSP